MQRLNGLTIISIAIIIGGIVMIAGGIVLFTGAANFSDSFPHDSRNNTTSVIKSKIADKVTGTLAPIMGTLTQVMKGIITSIASFISLVGVGVCVLGIALFKGKYLAWVLTIVLMFLAIVINVIGLGFVAGSITNDTNDEGHKLANFAYMLLSVMIVHLLANIIIIFYLTRRTTISFYRTIRS